MERFDFPVCCHNDASSRVVPGLGEESLSDLFPVVMGGLFRLEVGVGGSAGGGCGVDFQDEGQVGGPSAGGQAVGLVNFPEVQSGAVALVGDGGINGAVENDDSACWRAGWTAVE